MFDFILTVDGLKINKTKLYLLPIVENDDPLKWVNINYLLINIKHKHGYALNAVNSFIKNNTVISKVNVNVLLFLFRFIFLTMLIFVEYLRPISQTFCITQCFCQIIKASYYNKIAIDKWLSKLLWINHVHQILVQKSVMYSVNTRTHTYFFILVYLTLEE